MATSFEYLLQAVLASVLDMSPFERNSTGLRFVEHWLLQFIVFRTTVVVESYRAPNCWLTPLTLKIWFR